MGCAEPRAFAKVMGEHAAKLGGPNAPRLAAVSALMALIRSRSISLEAELPAVVHAIMRPLDPSVPSLREACLAAATKALRELVKRYPMLGFHQGAAPPPAAPLRTPPAPNTTRRLPPANPAASPAAPHCRQARRGSPSARPRARSSSST